MSADRLLATRPDLATAVDAYRAALRTGGLDPALLDRTERLVRNRIALRPDPAAADDDDPRTAAVLALADQFVIDPHGIDDAMRDAVLDHLTPAELAVLVQWLAIADGLERFRTVLS